MEQSLNPATMTLTKRLCGHLADARYEDLSPAAIGETKRGLLDWIGCALAGSRHATIDKLVEVLSEVGGKPQSTVFARSMKLGVLDAPLVNGQMGHLLDYDDTHMGGVLLHTSSPVLAALFSLAERAPVSGKDFMLAYAVGFEAGVRTGRTAPGHHNGGWHLTGTLGTIAAGVAAGKLLKLDRQKLTFAMGIAATQSAGMQQNRGTMCKSFHAGKAASNGVLAALLAEKGYDSTQEIVEGKKGFCRIYSDRANPEELIANLGKGWLIESNGHKPYACGVVLHPLIDAVIALRRMTKLNPAGIDELTLRVHPLALSIAGVVEPTTGLQSKFSLYHSAAVAFADENAGVMQYSDAKALDPLIVSLRGKIKAVADPSLHNDEAYATLIAGPRKEEVHIQHASGTIDNPMSDIAIEKKFQANSELAIDEAHAKRVCATINSLEALSDVRQLISLIA